MVAVCFPVAVIISVIVFIHALQSGGFLDMYCMGADGNVCFRLVEITQPNLLKCQENFLFELFVNIADNCLKHANLLSCMLANMLLSTSSAMKKIRTNLYSADSNTNTSIIACKRGSLFSVIDSLYIKFRFPWNPALSAQVLIWSSLHY